MVDPVGRRLAAILAADVNSYSYAGNNPILFKDASGKWYVDIGASFTAGTFTGGGGIRISNQGIVGYIQGAEASDYMPEVVYSSIPATSTQTLLNSQLPMKLPLAEVRALRLLAKINSIRMIRFG
jgi:hypothetical protein